MTTAVDGNVLIALWNEDDSLNALARSALDAALERGNLVIAAPVAVDWNLGQPVWRAAGRAFGNTPPAEKTARFWPAPHSYRFPDRRPRRQNGFRLLTLDDRLYRAAFPQLVVRAI